MSSLILRLAAPLQSWGSDSKYNERKTDKEPTKSGVLGMAAAALGCRRDDAETFARLSKLRFGSRVDREGKPLRDFQVTRGEKEKDNVVSERRYLCDAIFTVGLEGDEAELRELEEAFKRPAFPLFLGRRSCPPTGKLCLGISELPLEEALRNAPAPEASDSRVRVIIDDADGFAQVKDVPVSFSPMKREYAYRNVSEKWIDLPNAKPEKRDYKAD